MDNRNIEYQLNNLFKNRLSEIQNGSSELMNARRQEAMTRVVEQGLPTKSVERYRQTDIRSMYNSDSELVLSAGETDCQTGQLPIESIRVELCNGIYVADEKLTVTEQGVVLGSLAAATRDYQQIVEKYLNSLADNGDVVSDLNTAFVKDGFFLYVPSGVEVELPVSVVESYCTQGPSSTFGRMLMAFEANSKCTIVLDLRSGCSQQVTNNSVREIFVESGANVNIVEVQRFSAEMKNVTTTFVSQAEDSSVKSVSLTIDGGVVRNNWNVKLNGRGADNQTFGLALSNQTQHIDYCTNIEHISSDATSRQKFKSTASDCGRVVFNGRIYVAQDAQRTQAFQENRNLLMSDSAKIYAKPQLEIYADDVKCSHGATVGQLNAEEIYYMRQRGLSEADAKRLQVYGFVNEIISRVDNPKLTELLNELATAKIERM